MAEEVIRCLCSEPSQGLKLFGSKLYFEFYNTMEALGDSEDDHELAYCKEANEIMNEICISNMVVRTKHYIDRGTQTSADKDEEEKGTEAKTEECLQKDLIKKNDGAEHKRTHEQMAASSGSTELEARTLTQEQIDLIAAKKARALELKNKNKQKDVLEPTGKTGGCWFV